MTSWAACGTRRGSRPNTASSIYLSIYLSTFVISLHVTWQQVPAVDATVAAIFHPPRPQLRRHCRLRRYTMSRALPLSLFIIIIIVIYIFFPIAAVCGGGSLSVFISLFPFPSALLHPFFLLSIGCFPNRYTTIGLIKSYLPPIGCTADKH